MIILNVGLTVIILLKGQCVLKNNQITCLCFSGYSGENCKNLSCYNYDLCGLNGIIFKL